jgi:hypothetical protein
MIAVALGGCSTDLSQFSSINLNPLKGNEQQSADYNYFYRREQSTTGYVTAADLVGPDGRCAFDPGPAYPSGVPEASSGAAEPAPSAAAAPVNPRSNQALYFTAGPETGRVGGSQQAAIPPEVRSGPSGIALTMTECQVVRVAGTTDRVQIGANERGQRTVTLTYMSGDRPGIYNFRDGRLVSMERVEVPAQPRKPQRATKAAKSKQRQ